MSTIPWSFFRSCLDIIGKDHPGKAALECLDFSYYWFFGPRSYGLGWVKTSSHWGGQPHTNVLILGIRFWILARACRGSELQPGLTLTWLHSFRIWWPQVIPGVSSSLTDFHKVPFWHPWTSKLRKTILKHWFHAWLFCCFHWGFSSL